MQELQTSDSPANDLITFEVGQVYYANLPNETKAFITVTERTAYDLQARVDVTGLGHSIETLTIRNHTNANGVMVECLEVGGRLSWADLDASTVFGEEWVACYLGQ
jgi:hypothetical protein|tara:strand:- start:663 stop:980 length:318 start_codon:yes stop_codon:yes gene_type:complete